MSLTPSVKYIKLAGSMQAKPVKSRVAGTWVTVQDVAAAPTAVTATTGDTTIDLSWTPPANTGRIPITGYEITASPGSIVSTVGAITATTVSGLTNGTPYTATVKAINAVGKSAASSASGSVTPIHVTGMLYLSPASGAYNVGNTVTVTIRGNSLASAINAAQTNLTYDPAVLQYNSTDVSGSAFTTPLVNSGGSGSVQLSLGILGGGTVSGDQLIGVVSFTALAAATTTISFTPDSDLAMANGTTIVNQRTGASYTIS